MEGALILDVVPDSPADKFGLQATEKEIYDAQCGFYYFGTPPILFVSHLL